MVVARCVVVDVVALVVRVGVVVVLVGVAVVTGLTVVVAAAVGGRVDGVGVVTDVPHTTHA